MWINLSVSLLALFGVLRMVPLVILPMVPLVPLAYQWYYWQIGITIGTNGITIEFSKTLNDIGIPLVPLGNPKRTHCSLAMILHGTVMTLSFRTDRSGKTEEQSDQGLHCLLFHLHHFDKIPQGLASLFEV